MTKPHILVTGASGYLGTNLLSILAKNNKYNLTGLDIKNNSKLEKSIKFIECDLGNTDLLGKSLNEVDLICHCASLGGTNFSPQACTDNQILTTNIHGTQNLYQKAKEQKINKIVLTSSIAALSLLNIHKEIWPVNEDQLSLPDDAYGYSKNIQEIIARSFADSSLIQTIALRPSAFFPTEDPDRGFRLTGAHAMVEDIVSAHVAAIEVMFDEKKSNEIKKFEAIFLTNELPYKIVTKT